MFLEHRIIGLNKEKGKSKNKTIDMFIIKRLSSIYVYINNYAINTNVNLKSNNFLCIFNIIG